MSIEIIIIIISITNFCFFFQISIPFFPSIDRETCATIFNFTPIILSTFRKGAVDSIIRDTIADYKSIVPRAEITAPCARALPLSRKGLRRLRTLKRGPDLYIRNIIPLYWFF